MGEAEEEGESLLMQQIIVLVVVVAIFVGLLVYLSDNATGKLSQKELLAKQVCLAVTGSKPGTVINITTEMIIEKKDNGIGVKKNSIDISWVYPCESTNFEVSKEHQNTIININ